MQFPLVCLASLAVAAASETTNTFIQTLSGTSTIVPAGASINADNKLVYNTVEGGTTTSTYTDNRGYLTTSVGGGSQVLTTADANYVTVGYTLTTSLADTQEVSFGYYYTSTTYDINGNPHVAYFKQDPNIQMTSTSWDNDGKPHTYYLSASGNGVATIDAATVTDMVASQPTTDTSLTSYTEGKGFSTGLASATRNGGAVLGASAGLSVFLGCIAAVFI